MASIKELAELVQLVDKFGGNQEIEIYDLLGSLSYTAGISRSSGNFYHVYFSDEAREVDKVGFLIHLASVMGRVGRSVELRQYLFPDRPIDPECWIGAQLEIS